VSTAAPESEAVNVPSATRPESRSGGPGAAPRSEWRSRPRRTDRRSV